LAAFAQRALPLKAQRRKQVFFSRDSIKVFESIKKK
jgi:hypothetical protein